MHKYKILKKLGEGAQGIVSKALVLSEYRKETLGESFVESKEEEKTDKGDESFYVAMKKMKITDKENGVSNETLREIMCLREIHHSNVIDIFDIFGKEDHIYVIMPFMISDLEKVIHSQMIIKAGDIKAYIKMLLEGVSYIHNKAMILHRDLKPSNCLIGTDNRLVISDFGLAREYGSPTRVLSYQACTIWYRAPELLLGSCYYGQSCDIWSVGCIFGELMLRIPIFPGANEIDQLSKIFGVLGTPTENEWKHAQILPKYRKFETKTKFPLRTLFHAASNNGIDLFEQLMKFDPNQRIDAKSALNHKYFNEDRDKITQLKDLPDIRKFENK